MYRIALSVINNEDYQRDAEELEIESMWADGTLREPVTIWGSAPATSRARQGQLA
jgi:hypothetical protein